MTVWWTEALMFPHKAEVNTCLTDNFPSVILSRVPPPPTCRLKSSSRTWWVSWRPIRSNSRSVTSQPTRPTGSGWGRMFLRSPGRPRGTLSPLRYLTKANIAGWGTQMLRIIATFVLVITVLPRQTHTYPRYTQIICRWAFGLNMFNTALICIRLNNYA